MKKRRNKATDPRTLKPQAKKMPKGKGSAAQGSARHRGYAPARQLTEHEELTQRFMHYGLMAASPIGAEVPFMECDDEADYARLTQHFYPDLIVRG